MLMKSFLATTALVLCVSAPFVEAETSRAIDAPARHAQSALSGRLDKVDGNAHFLSWYGHAAPHAGSALLYEQSASSGFAKYAIASWQNDSAAPSGVSGLLAADDFIIPGKGTHRITAVYAAGVIEPEDDLAWVNVIFFDKLKYDKKTGTTTAEVKANCFGMPFTDLTGTGDLTIDVSTCNVGTFRGGHDYAIGVQPESADLVWYWQTNRTRIGRSGMWVDQGGGSGPCYSQLTPIKTCFPTKGYGPDLAFAIYGN